jgi:flagellar protein FlbD
MITLTKIDGNIVTVNCDLIESVDTVHDSTITMLNGKKIIVKENYEEIIDKTISYKRLCFENVIIKNNV